MKWTKCEYIISSTTDHNSFEPVSDKLIVNLINDKTSIRRPIDLNSFAQTLNSQEEKSNVILPPLAVITQQHKLVTVIQAIHTIRSNAKTKQMFVWATVKNIHDKKVIPFVEHMADVIVTLLDKKTLTILTKRSSGSVSKKVTYCIARHRRWFRINLTIIRTPFTLQKYQYEVDKSYHINVREIKGSLDEKPAPEPTIDPESLATFKINVDEEEMVARNAMTLPYEKTNEASQAAGPKIIYHPDSDDDFDEEDPDEDLYI